MYSARAQEPEGRVLLMINSNPADRQSGKEGFASVQLGPAADGVSTLMWEISHFSTLPNQGSASIGETPD